MPGEIISIDNTEKIVNYDKLEEELKQEKSKTDYWKNEHFQLSLKNKELKKQLEQGEEQYNDLVKETEELKILYDSTILENQNLKEVIDKAIEKIESWYFALDYAERDRLKIIVEILKEVE